MKKLTFVITGLIILFLLAGCGNNDETFTNIEQIQQNEGIPVRVDPIVYQPFTISLTYNANLSGIKETTLSSLISDRIDKIHVTTGDLVQKDDLLISFPEDNPSAQYIQAKAAYENALQTYERMSVLLTEGGISRQDLDQLETAKRVSEANLRAAEKMIYIRAPYSGTVTHLNLRETDSAGPGDPLITVSQIEKYQTKIWVTENDISSVKPGLRAVARWKDYEMPGRVVQTARSIDRARQAFAVDLEFSNPDNFLLTGVMASIELFTYENPETIIVERQFVMSDDQGHFVNLADGSRVVKRYITVGESDGIHYEVTEGLEADDALIKEGTTRIDVNSRIRIVE